MRLFRLHRIFLPILLVCLFMTVTVRSAGETTVADAVKFAHQEMQNGNLPTAQKWLLYALSKDPASLDAQFLQAKIDIAGKRYPEALQRADWLLVSHPKVVDYMILRMQILELMADLQAARQEAEKILQIDNDRAEARSLLAKIAPSTVVEPPAHDDVHPEPELTESGKPDEENAKPLKEDKKIISYREAARSILKDPEVLSRLDLSALPADHTDKDTEKIEDKLLKLFVQWKLGELTSKKLKQKLQIIYINSGNYVTDKEVMGVLKIFSQQGFLPERKQEAATGRTGWLNCLNQHALQAMQLGNLEEAWSSHVEAIDESATWHYCAARIALDRWLMEGRDSMWLQTARDFLERCLNSPIWKRDAEILIEQIDLRLPVRQ